METKVSMRRATKTAVICYGLGDLASQFIWTFVGTYLTIFYTDIVGFAPAVVSAIMLIARIWDAVNDPIMGSIAKIHVPVWEDSGPISLLAVLFLHYFPYLHL